MPAPELQTLPADTIRPADGFAAPDMSGMSLPEFVAVLRRRRMVIIQSFVLITLVAAVLTLMAHPVYRASARMIVEPASMSFNAVDTSNPLSAILAMAPPQSVHTQVEALRSPELLSDVMKKSGPAPDYGRRSGGHQRHPGRRRSRDARRGRECRQHSPVIVYQSGH